MKIKVIFSSDPHVCDFYEVHASDTIWSLKCAIYSKGTQRLSPPDDQRMVVGADRADQVELSDCWKTLDFYGVQEGSTIQLWVRRYGGEGGFRRLLDIFRKKKKTSLKAGFWKTERRDFYRRRRDPSRARYTRYMPFCIDIKHLFTHAHELGVLSLKGDGVFVMHHSLYVDLL
jgi:hypothetical protein